jgi:3-methylcrotonyl-CoA carboxylase alpha subunit
MFDKILIANRGEIACRVIRTARAMGISTVAVYSEADRDALHVQMADQAVAIGPAPATESYLDAAAILEAAARTGAQAVHPGYGFLSENAPFAQGCEQRGITFIGPPAAAIEAMGSKSAAKRIMEAAGVPLVPGYHGEAQDDETLQQAAAEMGYPVLLKAVAGGGGKGMRQVFSPEEFGEQLAAARREAISGFGNGDMLVERYLARPRHVEIQVFCDNHGSGVYLAERDCSVQRRHQKVIEEAPAPGVDSALRQAMGETALRAAAAIDYRGAGTVEFLLDDDGSYFFMEMNTRLQVEHPVTEMITGTDLVEWQLRVAAGEPLPAAQADIAINGHAIEARIYAEDPAREFLPATGRISYLRTPEESARVRIDTGVRAGDEISVYYDPMIAKLVVHGENRLAALRRMARALSHYRLAGLTTNIDFLYNLVTCAPFRAAELDTGFIERHREQVFREAAADRPAELAMAALYTIRRLAQKAAGEASRDADRYSPWHETGGWRLNEPHRLRLAIRYRDEELELDVSPRDGERDAFILSLDGREIRFGGSLKGDTMQVDIDGIRQSVTAAEQQDEISLYHADGAFRFRALAAATGAADDTVDQGNPRAPMTGRIVTLLCEAGTEVQPETPLLVMEAMKMEYTIRAPAAGRVAEFYYQPGDLVDGDAELLSFQPTLNTG